MQIYKMFTRLVNLEVESFELEKEHILGFLVLNYIYTVYMVVMEMTGLWSRNIFCLKAC